MTVNELIKELVSIRDFKEGNGDLPVHAWPHDGQETWYKVDVKYLSDKVIIDGE